MCVFANGNSSLKLLPVSRRAIIQIPFLKSVVPSLIPYKIAHQVQKQPQSLEWSRQCPKQLKWNFICLCESDMESDILSLLAQVFMWQALKGNQKPMDCTSLMTAQSSLHFFWSHFCRQLRLIWIESESLDFPPKWHIILVAQNQKQFHILWASLKTTNFVSH